MGNSSCNIYTDGSFNPHTRQIGCAFVLIDGVGKLPYRIAFSRLLNSYDNHGSCIAEMIAVITAIKAARSLGFSRINLHYDWTGLESFSHYKNIKSRHGKCPKFAEYANYMEDSRKYIDIGFIKVKAHSTNELNCLVDRMARQGRVV